MAEKIMDLDIADMLDSDEVIEGFLDDALSSGDVKLIAAALGTVARAKGMSKIARETGLAREQLYKSLSTEGNPTLETTLAVMKALGFQLSAKHNVAA